ncbi:MAG TPA: HEAT repeat domain-containing protein [Pyrinomonadaceae bacterium]|nr:HEAT repeat domain-containing protein [Pyrinomonadaceae bacterium]
MLKNLTSITATKRIALLFCVLALMAAGSIAAGQQRIGAGAGSGNRRTFQQATSQRSDATTVFRSARDLITDGNWAKAQEKFDEYVSSFPNEKNIDAALYWLAYAEHKLFKYDQCRSTIDKLLQKYPTSSWRDDARVLLAQVPGASAAAYADLVSTVRTQTITVPAIEQPLVYTPTITLPPMNISPAAALAQIDGIARPGVIGFGPADSASADDDDPCEFKIVVLQALFQTDVQRGIMAATEWLKPGSTQTVRCKSAALTLLGRNGGKAITPVILGVARNESDLKLRARAISALGATNDDSIVDALRDFAMSSQENDIVEASLYALSKHTGDRAITVLSDFATNGSRTIAQRKVAISSIASRAGEPAVDALFRIYDNDQNVEIRKAVISGFANRKSERAGSKLFEIARGSDSVELRKASISAISRRGGDKAVEFLLNLYDTEKNEELKDQIINSLGYGSGMFAGTPIAVAGGQGIGYTSSGGSSRVEDQRVIRKMIEIARSPQAPMDRRKRAIGWLSRSKDPEVLKFLEELLK